MKSLELWLAITVMVLASSGGDVLTSSAMKRIGDLGELRARKGVLAVIGTIFTERHFLLALCCFTVGFFSLLTALSWGDLSMVAPATRTTDNVACTISSALRAKED